MFSVIWTYRQPICCAEEAPSPTHRLPQVGLWEDKLEQDALPVDEFATELHKGPYLTRDLNLTGASHRHPGLCKPMCISWV